MFEKNIGLAKYIARNYFIRYEEFLNYEDLEDLKQEAIIELWKSEKSYKDIGYKFQTYATKRVKRRIYRLINNKISNNNFYEFDFNSISFNPNYEHIDMKISLSEAFNKLEFNDKDDLIALTFHLEGDSNREIAKYLNVSDMQTSRLVKRNLDKLKKIINNEM